jgi:DNA-binding NarL/FixJ family response regulator
MIARGQTVGEIGDELNLSIKTVSTYRTRVLEKLKLHSTADLVRFAIRNQLA